MCFFNSFLLACSYVHIISYVVLDTAVTKINANFDTAGGVSRFVQPQECIITTKAKIC